MSRQDNDAIKQGNLLRDKGDFDGAIVAYTEAIGLDSQNVEAYCGRAYSYSKKGEFDRAITDYTEAIRLAPKYSGAYYNRGLTYSRKDDLDEAIADFTEVIRLAPDDTEAYYSRGGVYGKKGDHDKAIADMTEAIRPNPEWFQAFYGRGYLYSEKGEFDKAITDFTEAIRLNPKHANSYDGRGYSYSMKGDHARAIADYTEAIHLNPKQDWIYYNRGNSYGRKGDHDKAIADYTEAIRLDPQNGYAFYARGYSYGEKGDKAKAKADFAQAKKLGCKAKPDSPMFVQSVQASRWKYGKPPRIVTPAAQHRLSFGWGSVIGGLLLPIFCLLLLFILAVNSSSETTQDTFMGFFTVFMLGLLGFGLILYDRQQGKRIGDLFENGIAHKSRIHKIGWLNIIVKTAPQWGGLVKIRKEDTLAPLSSGDSVMLFVDPENPKRRIILEQTTGAVFYDFETNCFDTRSTLPMLQFPAAVLFGTMSVAWAVLLARELLRLAA